MSSFGTNLKLICGMSKCIANILDNKNTCQNDITNWTNIINNNNLKQKKCKTKSIGIQCNLK